MQSLSRQIRRGNAYIYLDNVTKTVEVMQKRGTYRAFYRRMQINRLPEHEREYCERVTKPIRKWQK
jgi:hypothetical protein|nr:MAG TPA: hypothetical protein [Caudoviricetes sp.]